MTADNEAFNDEIRSRRGSRPALWPDASPPPGLAAPDDNAPTRPQLGGGNNDVPTSGEDPNEQLRRAFLAGRGRT